MTPPMETFYTTVVGALIAAVGALAGWIRATIMRMNAKHEACEVDRTNIKAELATVKEDVSIFKSCGSEPCGAREAMKRRAGFTAGK